MEPTRDLLTDQEDDLSFVELYEAIKKKMILILIVGLMCGGCAFGFASVFIRPIYESSAILIVNNRRDESNQAITYDEITSAQNLAPVYSIIIKSNIVMGRLIENLSLDMTTNELASKVTVSAIDKTQVINVAVRDENPNNALLYIQEIVEVAPEIIVELVEAGSVGVASIPQLPINPVSPNVKTITIMAFVFGVMISIGVVLLGHILDRTYRLPEPLEKELGIPVIGIIPNFEQVSRGLR